MKAKIDFANIVRLVAGLLALVLTVSGALFIYTIISNLTGLRWQEGIEGDLHIAAYFLFPLLTTLSTLMLAIYTFFLRNKEKETLLQISTITFVLALLSVCLYAGFIYVAKGPYYTESALFIPFTIVLFLFMPIIINSFRGKRHRLTLACSIAAVVIYGFCAIAFKSEIEIIFRLRTFGWTTMFLLSTLFVPLTFAIANGISLPKVAEVSPTLEGIQSEPQV